MTLFRCAVGALVAASLAIPEARAERPIEIISPGERSVSNKLAIGAVGAGGLIAGAFGLYFHLDSRSASDEVGTLLFTGDAWTPAHDELVDRAEGSRTKAAVLYSLGGALLIGAAVYWITTDPPDEKIVIHPRGATPTIVPTPGGAMLGGLWSF